MNKEMKELLGKAFDKAVPYTWDSLDYYEMEKVMQVFGELLVQKCADVCSNRALAKSEQGGLKEQHQEIALDAVSAEILDKFGVKE